LSIINGILLQNHQQTFSITSQVYRTRSMPFLQKKKKNNRLKNYSSYSHNVSLPSKSKISCKFKFKFFNFKKHQVCCSLYLNCIYNRILIFLLFCPATSTKRIIRIMCKLFGRAASIKKIENILLSIEY
jgi:hypothetical protein